MTTENADFPLTISARINRLFDVCRGRAESPQTTAEVAVALSRLIGRAVSHDELDTVRAGSCPPSPELLVGLSRHFGVPVEYLDTTGQRVEELDKQLRLLAAVRDAGVQQLALRGAPLPCAEALTAILSACPPPFDNRRHR